MFENGPLDVRRLAALDLHGLKGTGRRRRIIVLEFLGAAVLGLGLGLWVVLAAGHPAWRFFGAWMIGVGLNYVALTLHAIQLSAHKSALTNELVGLNLGRELKRYGVLSLWLFVPFLVAVLAVVQRRGLRRGS